MGSRKVQGSIDAVPFANGVFDLVAYFEVLEHLAQPNLPVALRELHRVSRKYIVVSVPNEEVLPESFVWCPQCSCGFHPSWHVRSFDWNVLDTLFPAFHMVERRPCGAVARYGRTRFASLAVRISRCRPPRTAPCPQCGFSEAANGITCAELPPVPGNAASASLWQRIMYLVGPAVLFTARHPYWLLAPYKRTDHAALAVALGRQTRGS